jgi:signal transduction histidine kinase
MLIISNKSYAQQVDTSLWKNIHSLNEQADEIYKSDISKAEILLDSAFKLVADPIDSVEYNNLLSDMGYIQQVKGNYEGAIKLFRKSLNITEAFGDKRKIAAAYLNFGNIYYLINDFNNSKENTRLSIKYLDESDSPPRYYGSRYNILGLNCFDNDELDSALFYYTVGITKLSQDSLSSESSYETLYDNIGQTFEMQLNYAKAVEYYRKSLEISSRNKWMDSKMWTINKLIALFLSVDKKDSASKYLQIAIKYRPKLANKEIELGILSSEIDFYAKYGNYDSLITKLNGYFSLTQELIEAKTLRNIQEMEAKYQLEKNASDLALAQQKSATLLQENKNQRIILYLFLLGTSFLVILILLIRRYYLQKRKVSLLEIEVKDRKLDELMSNQESEILAAMLQGQETERNRVARDLHDRLGGTLAALKLSLRRPSNKIAEEDLQIVDQAVQEVRDISHNLSGGLLEKYGLNDAIEQLRRTVERSGGIKFNVYLHSSIAKLGQNITLELYRVVQELVNNTLKHANASEISIQTNMNDGNFNLIYEDNGDGFDPKKVNSGIGLENIKSRINKIDGTIHWDAEIGRGTIVIIELSNTNYD